MNAKLIDNGNFVCRFIENSIATPNKTALLLPVMDGQTCIAEDSISYGELNYLVSAYTLLWQKKGWKAGDRIIVILKPSKDLYAIALSLFSMGMVAVFIDTGMGRKKIEMAIRDSNAQAIISMSALIKLFWFIPALWSLKRFAIDGQGIGYQNLLNQVSAITATEPLTCIARSDTDHGLISFTSGSTGRPKGADRTHFSLIQQHLAIRDHWPDQEHDIDCPCFPVMVLHNLSCGMSTIMPKVDLAQPAGVNAQVVIDQIRQHKISRLSGAPAYIGALVDYLNAADNSERTVTEIKSLVVGGATVSKALAQGIRNAFPNADAKIVYGSTEAEPISDVSVDEYLAQNKEGYLVGHVASQIDLLISNVDALEQDGKGITEDALLKHACQANEIGEILVSGHHVLKQYIDNPIANIENKIPRSNVATTKAVWHRTGDCGYLDPQGRLWLSGRTKDVMRINGHIIQPYPIEHQLDADEHIQRAAVIYHAHKVYVFVETKPIRNLELTVLKDRIRAITRQYFLPFGVPETHYVKMDKLPVDGRHNSKIDRPALHQSLLNKKNTTIDILKLKMVEG
jgi:acyl-CoA synthetase (AMP-forming)/AMP-acid ligase II